MNLLILAGSLLALHPAVEEHCFRCHGGEKVEGHFDLGASAELTEVQWREARALVERGEMPDRGPDPSAAEREAILAWIEEQRSGAPPAPVPDLPTRVRLTRSEYNHSLRDLLGIDLRPGDRLDPDAPGETGFTNDRLSLSLGPSQALKYLEAAEHAVDGLLALTSAPRTLVHWEAEAMEKSTPHLKDFDQGRLFATEPQLISGSVEIPADGYYEIRLHGSTMGKPTVAQILDGAEVIAATRVTHPRPTSVTHSVPALLRKGWRNLSFHQRNLVPQASLPRDADRIMNERAERNRMQVPELPPGATENQIEGRAGLIEKCFYLQQAFEWLFAYGTDGDARDIVRFRDYAVERVALEARTRQRYAREILGVDPAEFDREWERINGDRMRAYREHLAKIEGIKWMDWTRHQGQLYLDWIEIVGPVHPEGAKPLAPRSADLAAVATRAWRRPVGSDEIGRFASLDPPSALVAVISSPEFLFRDHRDPASRLSAFLWNSLPDARLTGTDWNRERTVRREVRRLLDDPKFEDALRDFTGQWLGTAVLGRTHLPDEYRFPGYAHLAGAAREEPVQFLLRLIREGRSLDALISADWTVANPDLADFYGVAFRGSGAWERVSLPGRANRGGLLGMSGVLAVTSTPVRTSPVIRGKWVWETLLGRRAGEPPPNAGILPATAGEMQGLTLRQEMERHRQDASCARCHEKMDPIGLALENFDAVGRWREEMAGLPIDAAGRFYRGESFSGPGGLKAQVLARREEFGRHLTRRLMEYAAGHSLAARPGAVDSVWSEVEARGGRADALFEAVALWLVDTGGVTN